MKKNLFYMMALGAALCMVSCGSDDDETPTNKTIFDNVTLTTPKYANDAVELKIASAEQAKIQPSLKASLTEDLADLPQLTDINITEGGKVVFELTSVKDGKTTKNYRTGNVQSVGNSSGKKTYKFDKGELLLDTETAAAAPSRASQSATVTFSVTINVPGYGDVTYSTSDNAAVAVAAFTVLTGGDLASYLCRTWEPTGIILDLKGDVTAFKTFSGGNLKAVSDEAVAQGADLTEKEKADFNKVVESIVATRTGQLYFNYTNGEVDACDWTVLSVENGKLKINLKDQSMGNKFLNDNSTLEVNFKEKRMTLKLTTNIKSGKTYECSLTVQLQARN